MATSNESYLVRTALMISGLDKAETQCIHGADASIVVVCVSDTHGTKPDIPDGDILIHAGDLTEKGRFEELQAQLNWLNDQPHQYKIVIAGNHDLLLDAAFVDQFPHRIYERPGSSRSDLFFGNLRYLCNSHTVLDFPEGRSIKVYGSPSTPYYGCWAFQYPPIRDVWKNTVPDDTDILVTHGPPALHHDLVDTRHQGCPHLLREIQRVRPPLAVFGHIHVGRGTSQVTFDGVRCNLEKILIGQGSWLDIGRMVAAWLVKICSVRQSSLRTTTLVNAAVLDAERNKAIVVEI